VRAECVRHAGSRADLDGNGAVRPKDLEAGINRVGYRINPLAREIAFAQQAADDSWSDAATEPEEDAAGSDAEGDEVFSRIDAPL